MKTAMAKNLKTMKGSLMLVSSSILLFVSVIFSMFSIFPMAINIFLNGRKKGYFVLFVGWMSLFAISTMSSADNSLFLAFTSVVMISIAIGEILLRKERPSSGVIKYGLIISFFALSILTSFYLLEEQQIKQELVKYAQTVVAEFEAKKAELVDSSNQGQVFELIALFKNTDRFIETTVTMVPRFIFVGIFISLWTNLLIILRLRKHLFTRMEYPFSDRDLFSFRLPENLIWFFIAAIGLSVYGRYSEASQISNIGDTALWCVGVFYFFQGVGLFLDGLTAFKIQGFFRFFIIFGVLMFVPLWWGVITLLGVFNTFFDFRRKINKLKKIQGE